MLKGVINERRKLGKFTVVDVSSSTEGWSASVVDAIVVFNELEIKRDNYNTFQIRYNSSRWVDRNFRICQS
jgi:hypothetical protein